MVEHPRKKRERHNIVVEILQTAKGGARKTRIMYNCNISSSMNERYLNALKKAGFITEKNGIWKTTEKGLHVIEACELCQRLLNID